MDNLLEKLKPYLKTRLLILGMGNTLRSDDGFGIILARRLKRKIKFPIWEVGLSLENYLERIVKFNPQTLLILDAFDFGGTPGQIRLFEKEDLETINLGFTHNSPLILAINYLQTTFNINIIILGIQPEKISFGRDISSKIKHSLRLVEDFFIKETNYAKTW